MAFLTHQKDHLLWQSSTLLDTPHAFTTRYGGVSQGQYKSLNLSPWLDDREPNVRENYRRIFSALELDLSHAVMSRQVHGDHVRLVTAVDYGKGLDRNRDYEADGLTTCLPDAVLVVFSADCVPILLFDPVQHAAAAVHAGWRGTVLDIAGKAVSRIQEHFGSRPQDIRAAIGPCISVCCFEVGQEVRDAIAALCAGFEVFCHPVPGKADKWMADLKGVNRALLERAGLFPSSIDVCQDCTRCLPNQYWSHRLTGNARGSQAAIISIKG